MNRVVVSLPPASEILLDNFEPEVVRNLLIRHGLSTLKLAISLPRDSNPRYSRIHDIISSDAGNFDNIPGIKHGDVLHSITADNANYRNSGKFMYYQKSNNSWDYKVVKLYYEIDDYGSLPPQFTLNDFPDANYFNQSIVHNRIRWIKFDVDDIVEFKPNKGRLVVEIIGADDKTHKYKLFYDNDEIKTKSKEKFYQKLSFVKGALPIEDHTDGEVEGANYDDYVIMNI